MSRTDETTPKIRAAMAQLGPADARTIAETAQVGYSTAVRKLRGWLTDGAVTRVDRGNDPAHWALADQPAASGGNKPPKQPTTDAKPAQDSNPTDTAEPPQNTESPVDAEPAQEGGAAVPAESGKSAGDAGQAPAEPHAAAPRRAKRELAKEVLRVLQANPDNAYKVSEVCKLIDQRTPGRKTSAGAVANALHKLAGDGVAVLSVEKPATYKAV